jgi:predicted phage baseplate assembly protein
VTMPWWRRPDGRGDPDAQPVEEFPELLASDSRSVRAAVAGRIGAFTPDWSVGAAGADAGVALVKVFGEQVEPVAGQVSRLPEKHAREQLRIAGVTGRGPRPGTVMVVITLVEAAPGPVPVPAGTQLTAAGTGGAGQVVFETASDLHATPARLRMLALQAGTRASLLLPSELAPELPVLAFGGQPRPGNALWLGFGGPAPFPRLTLAFQVAAATVGEASVAGGGVGGRPPAEEPTLSWELLTADGLVPAELQRDDTLALRQSGIVEVGTVGGWVPLPHPGVPDGPPESVLRWLRVGLLFGRHERPPRVEAVHLNAVMAEGAETIRDEILEPVAELTPTPARRFVLSRTPVLRRTVRLEVDAPDPADLFDLAPARSPGQQRAWTEVDTLARSRPYEQHFVVDELTGVVTFGDGVRGAAVPAGFRQVKAVSYRTGGGRATAVPAEAGFAPRQTIPFLAEIGNPAPAVGAADPEPVEDVVARGPALVRARGRAVTVGDLEALVLQASAELGRVVALTGADVDGSPRPGQLTLIAVGTRRDDGQPPVPTEATLGAVVRLLVGGGRPVAPLGTRVVVRAARFTRVELEITLRVEEEADRPAVVLAVARAVDSYLDPLTGGADRRGWPLGRAVRYQRLVPVVAGVPGVASVGRIAVVVDGRRSGPCRDAPLPPCTFPWPGNHLIVPVAELQGERR